jgi:predicted dehydrogenase
VALCETDPGRLAEGTKKLGVPGYARFEQMLEKEKPDVVHAVTRPYIARAGWIAPAAAAGAKLLLVEKPMALTPSELDLLEAEYRKAGIKLVVNMQRRYMNFAFRFRELVERGELGDVHYIRGNCQGDLMLDICTHLIDCILFLVGDAKPTGVWASAAGTRNFGNPDERAPVDMIATYSFASGARAFFEAVEHALGTANFPIDEKLEAWQPERCNFDVWGTKGRFWWREYGTWGYQLEGMAKPFVERTHFFRDDLQAQHLFTRAIGEWLDDERKPHLNRFELARAGTDVLFGAYLSALRGRRIDLPAKVTDADVAALRAKLEAAGGA